MHVHNAGPASFADQQSREGRTGSHLLVLLFACPDHSDSAPASLSFCRGWARSIQTRRLRAGLNVHSLKSIRMFLQFLLFLSSFLIERPLFQPSIFIMSPKTASAHTPHIFHASVSLDLQPPIFLIPCAPPLPPSVLPSPSLPPSLFSSPSRLLACPLWHFSTFLPLSLLPSRHRRLHDNPLPPTTVSR